MPIDAMDNDAVIWRYMNFTKFVSMLAECKLYLTRPYKFDDKWEGRFPPSYRNKTIQYVREHGKLSDEDEFVKDFDERLKIHRYGYFVNCWHVSDYESEAMWRLYGLSPEGVAIQSTKRSVMECLGAHNCGDVKYYDPSDDIKSKTVFGPPDILWKRMCFSWEREFRVWLHDEEVLARIERNEKVCEAELPPGKLVPIDNMETLITRIVVAPGAADWFFDLVRSVCGAYHKAWLSDRVERSYTDRSHASFIIS